MNDGLVDEVVGYHVDGNTGLIYLVHKLRNVVCDLCGYVDQTKTKCTVRKCDDGIYRCKMCIKKLNDGSVGG